MTQDITPTAGIDTAEDKLDIAIPGLNEGFTVANAAAGWRRLAERLTMAGVKRVGIEASGGYERGAVLHLRRAGFAVLLLQPLPVKAWAKTHLRRAKNDRIDAALIAAFRWNPALIALYRRLRERGKSHKAALLACAGKLLVYANTVLARRSPWPPKPAAS